MTISNRVTSQRSCGENRLIIIRYPPSAQTSVPQKLITTQRFLPISEF